MEIAIFTKEHKPADSIASFTEFYYSLHMKHLASDFLDQGLTPRQITEAVVKAMNVGKSSGMKIEKHFKPVFTGAGKHIVKDCKLSHLAYGLVLINADVKLPVVGNFQVSVLSQYLENQ
ncbi:hypothetical protein EHW67_19640 [Arenibacter aquaticus]|uniref:Uncharacterized protein n=1 Tax=Arenibacter aquaticus TaxID=2489054 RepID=A0A3S0AX76_9FLAO|nr:hypothetical protein [Arenibacter aquaticus]RTE52391.1 hypothetical protein EHW67_19640 [Arenibacter aquaticus]